jgi:hypothetical protein
MPLKLSHRCRRAQPMPEDDPPFDLPCDAVATPNGPDAANEAFEWMNRQVTWQSILADLEVMAWLAEGDPDR